MTEEEKYKEMYGDYSAPPYTEDELAKDIHKEYIKDEAIGFLIRHIFHSDTKGQGWFIEATVFTGIGDNYGEEDINVDYYISYPKYMKDILYELDIDEVEVAVEKLKETKGYLISLRQLKIKKILDKRKKK